jgi:osmotically-inducible protein OsmY
MMSITDAELERDVLDELLWEPSVTEKGIGVMVSEGIVTLTGSTPSLAEKHAAIEAVERVKGVRAVASELEVKLPSAYRTEDESLARTAAIAIEWDSFLPRGAVAVVVEHGWVTLSGTVPYHYQQKSAARSISYLVGVRGITNDIVVVSPIPTATQVKREIEKALLRHSALDVSGIAIEAVGQQVTLSGTVPSLAERRDAERAAYNAPGVVEVVNRLVVSAQSNEVASIPGR